jgi:hypothetical protein
MFAGLEDVEDRAAALPAASAIPQSPQNRLTGGLSAPHFGQELISGAPQSPQNFFPAGLSLSHFAHRIRPPAIA